MIGFLLRTVWRLVILALGVALAYVAAFIAFPYLDKRLPLFVALILVYVALAYFGLPTLFRTLRLIVRPDHIPLYATTGDGIPSDPVNIAVIAKSRRQLIKAMQDAGWYMADRITPVTAFRELVAIVLDKPYPNAPFSPMYLFNRNFDIGFELPYGPSGSPRQRHHVRFWQLVDHKEDKHRHYSFWLRHFRRFIHREATVWIGAAIDDLDLFAFRWYNLQITHRTHSQHHIERDFMVDTLERAGHVKNVSEVKAGDPFAIHSQQIGVSFVSDGRLTIVELKK